MTTAVRHTEITNTSGAAVVAGGALVVSGQDYAFETVVRTMVAADIGTGAGQTRHAAGMIFAEFKGANIKAVISATVLRTAGGFDYEFYGTDAVTANFGFSITNDADKSTLRIKDLPTGAAGYLAAADKIVVVVELGNS